MAINFKNIFFLFAFILMLVGFSCREYFNEDNNGLNNVSYLQNLTIAFVTPSYGPSIGGTEVIVQGIGFTTNTQVLFGDKISLVKNVDKTQLKVITPAFDLDTLSMRVNVIVRDVSLGLADTAINAFRYLNFVNPDSLFITKLEPDFGPNEGGVTVKISGNGFRPDTKVFFGESAEADIISFTSTEMQILTPAATGANSNLSNSIVSVKVVNELSGEQSVLKNAYRYGVVK